MSKIDNQAMVEFLRKSYFSVDGLWFLQAEKLHSQNDALNLDEQVWTIMPRVQTKKAREILRLQGHSIDNLMAGLSLKMESEAYDFELWKESPDILRLRIKGCPWLEVLKKSNRTSLTAAVCHRVCAKDLGIWADLLWNGATFTMTCTMPSGAPACEMAYSRMRNAECGMRSEDDAGQPGMESCAECEIVDQTESASPKDSASRVPHSAFDRFSHSAFQTPHLVDCHTHCWPDEIAERALSGLANQYMITPAFDGTVTGLLKLMDESGVDYSVVVPVATKPSQVKPINDWIAGIKNPRIIGFGAMHPDFPNPEEELDRMESLGIKGIKIQPNWQGARPDDPRMYPIYEAAQGRFIFIFHAGGELRVMEEELAPPIAMANVHRMFPGLTMVVAHLGGYQMWDEVEEVLIGEDVYLDLSCCFPEDISDERLTSMIRAHGAQKILFASDAPCSSPRSQFERIMSLPLSEEEKQLIAWKNAAKLFGIGGLGE